MTETRKVLGQWAGGATTVVTAYNCPASTEAIISSLVICNRSTATTCCAWVVTAADTNATDQFLYYDLAIPANDTFVATLGMTLSANDQLRCEGTSANLTFTVFGVEIS
jgi:hypothetical protein